MRARIVTLLRGDRQADRVVPPSGHTAWLTTFTAGAMTLLAVFALALSLASGRLADRWAEALARTATIRISAPPDQMDLQTRAVLDLLSTTPGIASARALDDAEQRALLAPWFGPDLPLEALPIPRLIELTETADGYNGEGLRQRLAAEAPGAVLDDHTRWRRPLAVAAGRLRLLGLVSVLLIGATMAAMITLAANAALYSQLEQPCIPVATNVGVFWPRHGIYRKPGVAVIEFLPAIPAGLPNADFMARLQETIETASDRLMSEAGFKP
ncbi:MAG: hypothetical protein U1D06_03240 [Paracoccaceae bacterium]|nr:hypothetical protein [Paracoccaceae bacterium]